MGLRRRPEKRRIPPARWQEQSLSPLTIVLFVLGIALLVVGAELLVRGASRLAIAAGVSRRSSSG
jgi:Ca2+/Na+ antiporter